MDLDEKIALTKNLILKREEIDQQLNDLLAGEVKRKQGKCGLCGDVGHTARTCPSRTGENSSTET